MEEHASTAGAESAPHPLPALAGFNGAILSDVAAELAGSVGLAGSANVGERVAMFEAIHGSAPDIAGQDIANPSGLLNSAVMMLAHIGQPEIGARIHNAWLRTLEDGIHTADLAGPRTTQNVGTAAFADAVIANLGSFPRHFPVSVLGTEPSASNPATTPAKAAKPLYVRAPALKKEMVGVDVFLHAAQSSTDELAAALQAIDTGGTMRLQMITNRGVKVWPNGFDETFCTDHWRCRFFATQGTVRHADIVDLLSRATQAGLDVIKTENLCTFDGEQGFALGQGQVLKP